jgi:UDP-N-acetylglucosamine 4,6-dehydratase/5-epimerase
MSSWLTGKRVLVTGGAGAFGQKFLEHARERGPAEVTVFSRDEMKHAALRRDWPGAGWLRFMLGDVTRPEDLRLALRDVDLVIHAAAMKQLAECEANPLASLRVNVQGTANVVRAFLDSSATALVFLSTDKAPYASSIYGAQKYMAEKLVAEANRLSTKQAWTLRYSNVMDSTGAAFHIFRQLLSAGKVATVNGPAIARGFVSQAQVLAALESTLLAAIGGETFVLVPRVVRIAELAETMRALIGRGQVHVTGETGYAGEKESATLIMAEETGLARSFPECDGVVLLDTWKRHADRTLAVGIGPDALTLDDCQPLVGVELREFVAALM